MIGEGFARFGLGLGDPPLMMAHPTIEYLYQPNQDRSRFGNRLLFNAYSMRSESDWPERTKPEQLRVLVLGDSIINGGNLTDHDELATTLLEQRLRANSHADAIVGNISTGSWSPQNLLAYVEEYGLFDADAALIVLNEEDLYDRPKFLPLNPREKPQTTPVLALTEGFLRYAWPRIKGWFSSPEPKQASDTVALAEEDALDSLAALRSLVVMLQQAGVQTAVVRHLTKKELQAGAEGPELTRFNDFLQELGVPQGSDELALRTAQGQGQQVYRDRIHLTASGQAVLADVLQASLNSLLNTPSDQETTNQETTPGSPQPPAADTTAPLPAEES